MPQHKASLDLHVCVDRPSRFVDVMAAVGGDCFIFQWEAMEGLDSAVQLAEKVVKAGMKCGISINPCTSVDDIFPLLERGLIDVVDILAVEPGFGGQRFQTIALSKIRSLKVWRELNSSLPFDIMVDGGINEETVADVFRAGADIMVAGTYLFRHPTGIETGASTLTQTTTV
jgi:ribulose-phosphate 3-epimerase